MVEAGIELHPRSRGFAWRNGRREGLWRLTPAEARAFDDDGYIVLRDVFTADEIAAVTEAIDPLEAEFERHIREQEGGKWRISDVDTITFTRHVVMRSPVLQAFARHPVIRQTCHDLIGDDVRLYWDQSVYKKSGKPEEFPWHQDNGYVFIEPQQYVTFWMPLVDVDDENGCPWVLPKVHKHGTMVHRQGPLGQQCLDTAPGAVCVPARAGDVVVFSSLTPHRTGPNLKAGTVRKAYILQYAADGSIAWFDDTAPGPQDDPDRQFLILKDGRPA